MAQHPTDEANIGRLLSELSQEDRIKYCALKCLRAIKVQKGHELVVYAGTGNNQNPRPLSLIYIEDFSVSADACAEMRLSWQYANGAVRHMTTVKHAPIQIHPEIWMHIPVAPQLGYAVNSHGVKKYDTLIWPLLLKYADGIGNNRMRKIYCLPRKEFETLWPTCQLSDLFKL